MTTSTPLCDCLLTGECSKEAWFTMEGTFTMKITKKQRVGPLFVQHTDVT